MKHKGCVVEPKLKNLFPKESVENMLRSAEFFLKRVDENKGFSISYISVEDFIFMCKSYLRCLKYLKEIKEYHKGTEKLLRKQGHI